MHYPEYADFVSRLIEGGFAVAATDYEGLGTPGEHPFLVPTSAARTMIDIVVAARQAQSSLSRMWFAVGHSQGGHAALATAEFLETQPADGRGLVYRGAVSLEASADFSWLPAMLPPGSAGFRSIYGDLLLGLMAQHRELRAADYFSSEVRLNELPVALERACGTRRIEGADDVTLAEMFGQLPSSSLAPRSDAARTQLTTWLTENRMPQRSVSTPIFLPTGTLQLSMPFVRLGVERVCALGSRALVRVYPNVDHFAMLAASAADVVQWLRDRLTVRPAERNCAAVGMP